MSKIAMAAATILSLTAGAALAQTTTETTTTQSTIPYSVPVPAPVPPAQVSQTTTQRTVDPDGVVTDHSKTVTTGTAIGPYGDSTTTRRTVETTTSR